MTSQNFFKSLANLNIHVPDKLQDGLYEHLKDSGKIGKIERYLQRYKEANKVEITKNYNLSCELYPNQDSSNLGFFEGIREMTGLTYLGRSVKQGVGEIASIDLGITKTLVKGLGCISRNVIGKGNTDIIANEIRDKYSAAKSSVSKGFSRGSYVVSSCGKALKEDIASVSPGFVNNVTVPKLGWRKTHDQIDIKLPNEPQILTSLNVFYGSSNGDTSVEGFKKFHKQQKFEKKGCLGKIWYSCKSCFTGKSTANQGSSGAGKKRVSFSSCWSFFASPKKNEEQVPDKYQTRGFDQAVKEKKEFQKKVFKNDKNKLDYLQENLLLMLSNYNLGIETGQNVLKFREDYQKQKIDKLFEAINKETNTNKKREFLKRLSDKINYSITSPNNHSIATFINNEHNTLKQATVSADLVVVI